MCCSAYIVTVTCDGNLGTSNYRVRVLQKQFQLWDFLGHSNRAVLTDPSSMGLITEKNVKCVGTWEYLSYLGFRKHFAEHS